MAVAMGQIIVCYSFPGWSTNNQDDKRLVSGRGTEEWVLSAGCIRGSGCWDEDIIDMKRSWMAYEMRWLNNVVQFSTTLWYRWFLAIMMIRQMSHQRQDKTRSQKHCYHYHLSNEYIISFCKVLIQVCVCRTSSHMTSILVWHLIVI